MIYNCHFFTFFRYYRHENTNLRDFHGFIVVSWRSLSTDDVSHITPLCLQYISDKSQYHFEALFMNYSSFFLRFFHVYRHENKNLRDFMGLQWCHDGFCPLMMSLILLRYTYSIFLITRSTNLRLYSWIILISFLRFFHVYRHYRHDKQIHGTPIPTF